MGFERSQPNIQLKTPARINVRGGRYRKENRLSNVGEADADAFDIAEAAAGAN
jgi:hypothetical protein